MLPTRWLGLSRFGWVRNGEHWGCRAGQTPDFSRFSSFQPPYKPYKVQTGAAGVVCGMGHAKAPSCAMGRRFPRSSAVFGAIGGALEGS